MRILVASDSFKDGCSSIEACEAISRGIKSVYPAQDIVVCPISDGGEGAVEILQYHLGGEVIEVQVSNPLFKRINAHYLLMTNDRAFIEMAQASGLELLQQQERNPMNTSTFGTGELIKDALHNNCSNIFISVGGSATNDLGMGMASALGVQFEDDGGNSLAPIGYNMPKVSKVNVSGIDPNIEQASITVITDVNNPLYGRTGAAYVYGGQKGANEVEIKYLDQGLQHLSKIIKENLRKDIANVPGAGAAGGVGGGCLAFLGAEISSGISLIGDLIDLESEISSTDIVITGEGQLDRQTVDGKVISGICKLAKKHKKEVIVFCGNQNIATEDATAIGIKEIIQISESFSEAELEIVLAETLINLEQKAAKWASSRLG